MVSPEGANRPVHLHLTAEPATRALLPGDPGRALRLAQALLDKPLMLNHNRGLWGYSGNAKDSGAFLSIQSTGMGGPSAAIVVHELIDVGVQDLIRVGTCGALGDDGLALGDLVIIGDALPDDGTSRALGAGDDPVAPHADLLAALTAAAPDAPVVRAVTTDVFYRPGPIVAEHWLAAEAQVVEMEAATVFTVAANRGARAAGILIVSDLLSGDHDRRRIDPETLETAELRLGEVAAAALTAAAA